MSRACRLPMSGRFESSPAVSLKAQLGPLTQMRGSHRPRCGSRHLGEAGNDDNDSASLDRSNVSHSHMEKDDRARSAGRGGRRTHPRRQDRRGDRVHLVTGLLEMPDLVVESIARVGFKGGGIWRPLQPPCLRLEVRRAVHVALVIAPIEGREEMLET